MNTYMLTEVRVAFKQRSHTGTHRPNNLAPTIFGLACTVLKLESIEECRHRKPIKMNNLTEEVQVPSEQIATYDQICQFGSTAIVINIPAERQTHVHRSGNLFIL